MTNKNPIAEAIRLLTESADEYRRGISIGDVPDWAGEPETKAAYDETMAVVAGLRELVTGPELTEKQLNIIGAPWHFNLLVPKEKAEVFAFARAAITADRKVHRKDAAELREMLRSLQAGEMTVSRARELIDMWLAGNYSDDQLPPASNYPMGEDDEPMALLVAKDSELAVLKAEKEAAYKEAAGLATSLFQKHYASGSDYASGRVTWGLCDSTAGVLTQIDNMVSGLVMAPAVSDKDTAALIEIDRVMLESGTDWPDIETDALVVRHVKELTRMLKAERAAVQALREQVSRAVMTGTPDFRRHYDAELLKVVGVAFFQDLYVPAVAQAVQPVDGPLMNEGSNP